MKIVWEVKDGYVGGSRPQETIIPDEEFVGLDDEEKEDLINNWVQNEFEERVSWAIIRKSDE